MEQWIKDALYSTSSYSDSVKMLPYFIAIVVIYVFIIIPGGYFILKKKDALKYLRELIVITAVLFSGLIFVLGARTRITAPTFKYIRIIDETREPSEYIYASVQLPYIRAAQLQFAPDIKVTTVEELEREDNPEFNFAPMQNMDKPDKPGINIAGNAVLEPEYFLLERNPQDIPQISACAKIADEGLEINVGEIQDITLMNAYCVYDGEYYDITGLYGATSLNKTNGITPGIVVSGIASGFSKEDGVVFIFELYDGSEDIISDASKWQVDGSLFMVLKVEVGDE